MTKGDANRNDDYQLLTSSSNLSIHTNNVDTFDKKLISDVSLIRYDQCTRSRNKQFNHSFYLLKWQYNYYDILYFRGKIFLTIPKLGLPVIYIRNTFVGKVLISEV